MTVEELHDEIEAINAIYPQCCTKVADHIYSFVIPNYDNLSIQLSFPTQYPDEIPHLLQLIAKDTTNYADLNYIELQFRLLLESVFMLGIVCIFELLSECDAYLQQYDLDHVQVNANISHSPSPEPVKQTPSGSTEQQSALNLASTEPVALKQVDYTEGWTQAEPILDRGSTFIGFARQCQSPDEAKALIQTLCQDRRIARATHNITSWRIQQPGGIQFQDCDDDGETAAGGRLLHLLTMMNAWNVVVVVSRWFGGTQLGPDRFKHINSAAREAVLKGNFASDKNEKTNNTKSSKKSRK